MFHSGQQIGPYALISRLGRGGFGEVWLAEKRSQFFAKKVAVKLPLDDQVNFDAIHHEAVLWEQASGHANVLPIIDADVYDGQIVIVSEYASGGSLHDRILKDGSITTNRAVEFGIGILNGLEYLHDKKIVHRDIKPQNVLLQGDTPRLADFGISRAMQTTAISSTIVGTDAYMSPESFDGKRNVQTDIWSVGVVLYQMLSGKLPFPQEHPSERMFAILTKDFEPLPELIPRDLRIVVSKALAKESDKRYRSSGQMRDDLLRVLAGFSKPEASATEVLQPREKLALPTELIPNSTENKEPAAPTQFVFSESTVGSAAESSHQPDTSIFEHRGDSHHYRRFNKSTKLVAGLTIGLALLIVGFEAAGRMSDIWDTDLQHPNPEPTRELRSPAETTPSNVPFVSPTPEPSPSPSGSPDIKGRYSSGGYFNLDIKKTDNRGFTFWLHPGNDHGIGEIDGRATWSRSSVATFRKTDVSTAKDTGEVLNRSVCRIDFQLVDTSVKVSENGCVDWHGQSPTYNGTYLRKVGAK